MTIRSKKRKAELAYRKAVEAAHAKGEPIPPAPQFIGDYLEAQAEAKLERQALNGGWLDRKPESEKKRKKLIEKIIDFGLEATDPAIAAMCMRAVASAELRAIALELQEKKQQQCKKPVVVVNNNAGQQIDTLSIVLEKMSSEQAIRFLNEHGSKLPKSTVLPPNDTGISGQPYSQAGSPNGV